jgi:hypothetical protein
MSAPLFQYVYAILPATTPVPTDLAGSAGNPLEPVRYRDLVAVTSAVDPKDVRPREEDVVAHESIVEALHRAGPLLPVRFGTLLPGKEDVERALAKNYDILMADLERLGDKVEFGLTVLWDETPADGGIDGDEPTSLGGPGARYLQTRLAEHRRETAVRARAQALAESLDASLAQYAVEGHQTVYPSGRIAVRAAYLLPPARVHAFQSAFERSREQHPEVRCLLSGPWPPYSFVTAAKGRSVITGDPHDGANRSGVPGQQT